MDVDPDGGPRRWLKQSGSDAVLPIVEMHGGRGTARVRAFGGARARAGTRLLVLDLPPGGSEGVHTHALDDPEEGAWDEHYYIVSGEGVMTLDGERIAVAAGDYVHAPLGVAHGIENGSGRDLKVLLVYVWQGAPAS